MLLLAVHNLNEPASAKVPFSMVVLMDCVSKKLHPPELKALQILPTSGLRSVSLWEAPSTDALRSFLDELLEVDCKSEVYQVQEQCMLSNVPQSTASSASQPLDRPDERFKVSEQAGVVLKTVSDGTRTAVNNLNSFTKTMSSKAMENEKVATTATVTAQAFRDLGDRLKDGTSSLTSSFRQNLNLWTAGSAASGSPKAPQTEGLKPEEQRSSELAAAATPSSPPSAPDITRMPAVVSPSPPAPASPPAKPAPRTSAPRASPQQPDVFSLGDEEESGPAQPVARPQAGGGAAAPSSH